MCTPHVHVRCTYLDTLCAPRIKTSVLTSESICTCYYLCIIFSRYTDPARFGRFRIIVSCDSYNVNVYNNLDIRRLSPCRILVRSCVRYCAILNQPTAFQSGCRDVKFSSSARGGSCASHLFCDYITVSGSSLITEIELVSFELNKRHVQQIPSRTVDLYDDKVK